MELDLVAFWQYICNQWSRRSSLVLSLLVVLILGLFILPAVKWESVALWHLLVMVGAMACVTVFWLLSNRPPRVPKDVIGFGVAISCETPELHSRLRSDFLEALRRRLAYAGTPQPFMLLEIPPRFAGRIKSGALAHRLLLRTRCVFMIYGTARTRNLSGEPTHVIDLVGIVRHATVTDSIKKRFASEFTELFQPRYTLACEDDMRQFEVTAGVVDLVSHYIIGLAALMSGFLDVSLALFEHLTRQLQDRKGTDHISRKIRSRLPLHIGEIHLHKAHAILERWRGTHADEDIALLEPHTAALTASIPGCYEAALVRAIGLFLPGRDVTGAIRLLRRFNQVRDVTWLFSLGFLYAYSGDMCMARKAYAKAFRGEYSEHVPLQTEDFMEYILSREPDKGQLHFAAGLVNLKAKEDLARALEEFQAFASDPAASRFPDELRLARGYLGEIRHRLDRGRSSQNGRSEEEGQQPN
jgi:hypothetical protein